MTARSGVPAILVAADDMAATIAERDRYRQALLDIISCRTSEIDSIAERALEFPGKHAAMVAFYRATADGVDFFAEHNTEDTDEIRRFGTDRIPVTAAEIRAEADRLENNP